MSKQSPRSGGDQIFTFRIHVTMWVCHSIVVALICHKSIQVNQTIKNSPFIELEHKYVASN